MIKTISAMLMVLFASTAWADVTAPQADKAVRKFCDSIRSARSINDLRRESSTRFAKETEDIQVQPQWTALPADVRALIENKTREFLKGMAVDFPDKMVISCKGNKCIAQAQLTSDWRQSLTLVEERGTVLIDGMEVGGDIVTGSTSLPAAGGHGKGGEHDGRRGKGDRDDRRAGDEDNSKAKGGDGRQGKDS
jgi:hypothetical protein